MDPLHHQQLTTLFATLSGAGVASVSAKFDGYGDEGWVEEIGFFDAANASLTPSNHTALTQDIRDLCYALLEERCAGWENESGSFGTLRFIVAQRQVRLELHG